jgi:hypothetical protein
MIGTFKVSAKDRSRMESKATKNSANKHDSKLKNHVKAGFRRLSLTFGKDFNDDRAAHKKQYEADMKKMHGGTKKKGDKSKLSQKVSGTVRRLSVSIGLKKR